MPEASSNLLHLQRLRMASRRAHEWIGMSEGLVVFFCLSIRVPRHSTGGVGSSVCPCIRTWYVLFAMCMWFSKSDYGFCLGCTYTYQDHGYIIRTMTTKHDQCTALHPPYPIYIRVFLLHGQAAHETGKFDRWQIRSLMWKYM